MRDSCRPSWLPTCRWPPSPTSKHADRVSKGTDVPTRPLSLFKPECLGRLEHERPSGPVLSFLTVDLKRKHNIIVVNQILFGAKQSP